MSFGFTRLLDVFLGRGESAITVPALDGALRPNRKLDDAAERIAIEQPSGIASRPDGILVSSGDRVFRWGGGAWVPVHKAEAAISCLAEAGDGIAIGLENGTVGIVGGRHGGAKFEATPDARCPVAVAVIDGSLYVCHGSAVHGPAHWQRDLLERNASGSVWRIDLASGKRNRLANNLAFPAGIAAHRDAVIVSESWRHRVLRLDRSTGKVLDIVLGDLPGYPGHIASDGRGGCFLSVFAPRSQLVEFVLREPRFKQRMIAEVEPRYWVAPTYRSGGSFYEPLQGGGVKHLGILKPWAPTLSFGMVVRLDESGLPLESFQSRADGKTHGIVATVVHDGALHAVSRGDNLIAKVGAP